MRRCLFAAAAVMLAASASFAQDEIYRRGQEKPTKAVIKSESAKGIVLTGAKDIIPAEDIVDVFYQLSSTTININDYRPAFTAEKESNDLTLKEDVRKTKLALAIKKYQESAGKITDKTAKRQATFKAALLLAKQAAEEGAAPDSAIAALKDFRAKNPDAWQTTLALQTLARLHLGQGEYKEAAETFKDLAEADVSDDAKQDAELSAAQVSIRAKQPDQAMAKLQAIVGKVPADSKFAVRAQIAMAEVLAAQKKNKEAIDALRQLIKKTTDKNLKAQAYNTLGECLLQAAQPKDARWEFLWVDVVYNQDRAEHARALYHLWKIFDSLGETERAQECLDTLVNDRQFAGLEYQRRALKERAKGS